LSTLLRNGIFRTLVVAQCLVVIGASYFSRTLHGPAQHLLEALQFLLPLGLALCVVWLQRATRTALSERRRTEQLKLDRNHVLEMLVGREDTPKILQALTETVAHHNTSLSCALHLLEADTLNLAAHASLPSTLVGSLQQLATSNMEVPECTALNQKGICSLGDLRQVDNPWSELLRDNGAQSVWTAPIFAADDRALGTISVYSLQMHPPGESDIEFLQTSCRLASLVLERHQMNEELIYRAYHDPLTGLGNRRLGKKGLEGAMERAQRDGRCVGVLWIGLDKFKEINDTYGHPAGDFVLRETARRLLGRMRRSDTVARMGGDEFMVVVERMEERDNAQLVANDLLKILAQPIQMGETQLNVTASVGISTYPEDGVSADVLEQHADLAMHDAKFGGLGLSNFRPVLIEGHAERLLLEAAMRRGLEEGAFSLVYQPQCFPSGKLISLEALLRFNHPQLGNVPPARFIPIAEDTQLILPIGRWVLKEVCRQLKAWQQAGCEVVSVAVNISAIQFARNDFSGEVAEILAEAGVHPSLLELELTESLVMRDFAESARQMQDLKDLGVRIAIDDFGTGYSSLSYLHRLPIDTLKIDRSFVEMIAEPEGTRPIVDAVISMSQALGLRVVGEGVETLAQMEALCKGGCDLLQGNLFSRPVPAEQVLQFLRHHQLTLPSVLNFPKTAA
jgi:diguanylate cyclase (GGDEF)-like protein